HGPTTTSPPPAAAATSTTGRPGPPPASLSEASVSSILASLSRSSPSSSLDLLAALRPLQDLGFTPEAAALAGMGRFPLAGPAYYSDDFGDPRSTPEPHTHKGTDVFAAFGTPVRSPANGVLRYGDEPAAGGLVAYVTEPDGTWYYLAHLQKFAPGLTSGATVRIGDVIGYNGDTGNAKGGAPHVHFELHPRGGAAVNPKYLLDQWLAEAKAAIPALLAQFRQDLGSAVTRPLTNVGLVRRFDQGMLAGPSRLLRPPVVGPPHLAPEQRLADALLSPLTPPALVLPDRAAGRL
ncbi:MAG: M23 family metallopeptidase, partial [Acidimicrobiales bacterium]